MKMLFFSKKTLLTQKKAILIVFYSLLAASVGLATCVCAINWLLSDDCGSQHLGSNFYLLDWDGGGKIIVRGTTMEGNTCYGGEQLIPTYERQYDKRGNFAEYVADVKFDDNWIIVKTNNFKSKKQVYYIIDKRNISEKTSTETIISTRIERFDDSISFSKKCIVNGIEIKWH